MRVMTEDSLVDTMKQRHEASTDNMLSVGGRTSLIHTAPRLWLRLGPARLQGCCPGYAGCPRDVRPLGGRV